MGTGDSPNIKNFSYGWSIRVFIGGIAEHVRAPVNGKIKLNEYLVHSIRTHHGHPAFLYSINLYVTIESQDIIQKV